MKTLTIPFHRPDIGEEEVNEVVATLRSGWLTTGPKTKAFESAFAKFCGLEHAVALNSATAALHLALDAVGLKRGEAVLVPTMTFAASAEVVRYFDAEPILFDCNESDLNGDMAGARATLECAVQKGLSVRAIIVVHYGGLIGDMAGALQLAKDHGLAVIEDAAHCCPAWYRHSAQDAWRSPGAETQVACYSFYANKCITTGEGGMAVTSARELADRMRVMALHGISKDAWKRFTAEGSWYYEIIAPGFKYNLTDIASAIGLHQLARAEAMRKQRERVAGRYLERLATVEGLTLPSCPPNRIHSWHLFAIRIDPVRTDRGGLIEKLKSMGIGTSVHWMPLHMHPYYRERFGYRPEDFPTAAKAFQQLVSLPIYPGMGESDIEYVTESLRRALRK